MDERDADEVVFVSDIGVELTVGDIAGMSAFIGAMPLNLFDMLTSMVHPDDLQYVESAYYKSKLLYNDALEG